MSEPSLILPERNLHLVFGPIHWGPHSPTFTFTNPGTEDQQVDPQADSTLPS